MPHEVLVQILERVDYDLAAARALMRVDRRFRDAIIDERGVAKLVVKTQPRFMNPNEKLKSSFGER